MGRWSQRNAEDSEEIMSTRKAATIEQDEWSRTHHEPTSEKSRNELTVGDVIVVQQRVRRFKIVAINPGDDGPHLTLECDGVTTEHDTSLDPRAVKYAVER
jgi:hypothetical protein